jgi:hypothetical protein
VSDCTVSYRPVLSSERAPFRKNNKAIVTKERIRIKSGHGPQKGALYQDEGRLIVGRKIKSTQLICSKKKYACHSSWRPKDCEMSSLTHFLDNRLTVGGEVVSFMH